MKLPATALALWALSLASCLSTANDINMTVDSSDLAIAAVLDSFHDAAATADGERYFGHFAKGGVFIGTDANERWTVDEFRAFAMPYFDGESAWTYLPFERHIDIAPGGQVAWFDEKLTNASYGETRGSGALIWERGEWRISQYVLSFPVPNDIAKDVVELIQQDADSKE